MNEAQQHQADLSAEIESQTGEMFRRMGRPGF
jgi:hypothetical protein